MANGSSALASVALGIAAAAAVSVALAGGTNRKLKQRLGSATPPRQSSVRKRVERGRFDQRQDRMQRDQPEKTDQPGGTPNAVSEQIRKTVEAAEASGSTVQVRSGGVGSGSSGFSRIENIGGNAGRRGL